MNNQQLREGYLKAEVQRLTDMNKELLERLNEKTLIDRLLIHALSGAAARLEKPEDAAKFAIECVDQTLNLLSANAKEAPPAPSGDT